MQNNLFKEDFHAMAAGQEAIANERLLIKPFKEDDWINLRLIRSDSGFRRYMLPANAPSSLSEENYKKRAIEFARAATQGPCAPRLICLKDSGEVIGSCGVIETANMPLPELSFFILTAYRQQGYCLEAVRLLLKSLNGLKVGAFVNPENSISIKVLERLGLKRVSSIYHPIFDSLGLWFE